MKSTVLYNTKNMKNSNFSQKYFLSISSNNTFLKKVNLITDYYRVILKINILLGLELTLTYRNFLFSVTCQSKQIQNMPI